MPFAETLNVALNIDGVAILPPMDVFSSISLINASGIHARCTILDPWYNKGFGGELPLPQYDEFITQLLNQSAEVSDVIYLWGFPEIIGPYVRNAPEHFRMTSWLTWYYKNRPSVIRGWRPSQNACLQFVREGCKLYPEHFLTDEQKERFESGKMRFVQGPSSVIEAPLIVGFVGKKERTGHPSQKPEAVFDKLLLMAAKPDDIIIDPMAGSGTTAACARQLGMKAIVCDINEDYINMMENRLGVKRLALSE